MSADTVIALVYRVGKGCRQYPFHDFDSLVKFCERKPYCDEYLNVHVVHQRRIIRADAMHASKVFEFVVSELKSVHDGICARLISERAS